MNLLSSLAIIISQAAIPASDRHEENRSQRLEVITIAITRASERATCTGEAASESCRPIASDLVQVAAELYEIARAESDFAQRVHAGHCRKYECDPLLVWTKSKYRGGKLIRIHRAHGIWQQHCPPSMPKDECEAQDGVTQEATDLAAWRAAKLLAGGHGVCGTTEGAVSYYALGRCVAPIFADSAKRRTMAIERTKRRLRALMGQVEQKTSNGVAER